MHALDSCLALAPGAAGPEVDLLRALAVESPHPDVRGLQHMSEQPGRLPVRKSVRIQALQHPAVRPPVVLEGAEEVIPDHEPASDVPSPPPACRSR